jgi:hypothetical protein
MRHTVASSVGKSSQKPPQVYHLSLSVIKIHVPLDECLIISVRNPNQCQFPGKQGTTEGALSWIGGLTSTGQLAARFAADVLYGKKWDPCLKGIVRYNGSLEEFLANGEVEPVFQKIEAEAKQLDDNEDNKDKRQEDDAMNDADEHSFFEFAAPDGADVRALLEKSTEKEREIQSSAVAEARELTKTLLTCVPTEEVGVQSLADNVRNLSISQARGNRSSSVLFIYDVEAAGENVVEPRRAATPLRRDHLEKVIHSCLASREEAPVNFEVPDGDVELGPPAVGDVYVFQDGGRRELGSAFQNIFRSPSTNKERKLHVVYSEESITEHKKALW